MNVFSRIKSLFAGFNERVLSSGTDDSEFSSWGARRIRYAILWAAMEGTLYSDANPWARSFRQSLGLYKYTRPVYNPAYRLVEFWRAMIWGGALDLHLARSGAIPVVVGIQDSDLEEKIRKAIVKIWKDSNWSINKGVCAMLGAALGDVGIKIVDDPERRIVRLEVVHPADIVSVERDAWGNIKGYVIEREVEIEGVKVIFREEASRVKDADGRNTRSVLFRTYRNGEPYAWNGIADTWTVDYGFVPFVMIQHNNLGLEWGWAEIFPALRKVIEVDDVASMLHDQIRKSVSPVWLANFLPADTKRVREQSSKPTLENPQPGREELPFVFVSKADAKAEPLLANIQIGEVSREIENMVSEYERDYPELQIDIWKLQRDVSGTALSRVRKRLERKVIERRENYDNALTRALQMAISIGGFRKYNGFEAFDLESYREGKLDFWIDSQRPIFDVERDEEIERKLKFWQAVQMGAAVVPAETVLRDLGWSEERLAEIGTARLAAIRLAQEDTIPEVEQ